jgi:hypothetical protein
VLRIEFSDRRLGDFQVLIHRAAARAQSAHHRVPDPDGNTVTTFSWLVLSMPNNGLPDCAILPSFSVGMSNARAVQALLMEMSTLPSHAPSMRTWATSPPPASTTARL